MNNNTALSLNQIIYEIYNTEDFSVMKNSLLRHLKTLIPCTCVSIMMADPHATYCKTCSPSCFPPEYVGMEKKFLLYQKEDYTQWIVEKDTSILIKSSQMMPEEDRVKTALYQKCYAPYGVHYSLDYTIVERGIFLGVLAMYRNKDEGDFVAKEEFLIQLIGEHLSRRFFEERRKRTIKRTRYDMSDLIRKYSLTSRECEIFQMILDGRSNDEIVENFCISKLTLKKHLQNIYRKTGVSSKIQLFTLQCDDTSK